jgi:chitinase
MQWLSIWTFPQINNYQPIYQSATSDRILWYLISFDYDFRRVPRDVGETQMRLDFSNEEGYWDKVVDKAAGTKRKRSLDDVGGNHKRWLEETWREDYHSGLSEELHKRWFW